MTTFDAGNAAGVRPTTMWRHVAVPSEHGGWNLTAEPVVLGLLVAWSSSGVALGLAAMLAFVARTTLKVVQVDRWRHRWLDRGRVAGDASTLLALGLWVVVSARAAAAIPYVRTQVFRAHGRTVAHWRSDLAQVLAATAVAVAWAFETIPFVPVVVVAMVAIFNVGAVRGPDRRAVVIGLQQMFLGMVVLATTAIAVLA